MFSDVLSKNNILLREQASATGMSNGQRLCTDIIHCSGNSNYDLTMVDSKIKQWLKNYKLFPKNKFKIPNRSTECISTTNQDFHTAERK